MTFKIKKELFVDAQAAIEAFKEAAAGDVFVTIPAFVKEVVRLNPFNPELHGSRYSYEAEIAAIIWHAGRLYGKKK